MNTTEAESLAPEGNGQVADAEVADRADEDGGQAVRYVRRSWTSRISSVRQMRVKSSLPKTAKQQLLKDGLLGSVQQKLLMDSLKRTAQQRLMRVMRRHMKRC